MVAGPEWWECDVLGGGASDVDGWQKYWRAERGVRNTRVAFPWSWLVMVGDGW